MAYPTHLLPTTVVGSYPQPDWLVNREALEKHGVPRTHAPGHLAHPRRTARAGAGRCDHPGDPRHGARRHRHHHRWRDPPRKLLQPVRAGARGDRCRHPGEVRSQPARTRRCRASSARSAAAGRSRCAMSSSCAADRPRDEDHAAGPVHAVAAGEERVLCRRGRDGDGLRRRRQRGVARPEGERRRCGATRRAWVRTAPDKAERYGVRAINRALEGIEGPTVVHLCFGYAHVVHNKPSRLRLPAGACGLRSRSRSRSRRRSRSSISACWPICRASRSCSACSISATPRWRPPEQVAERIRAGLRHVAAERLIPAPDCGMKYMPRERAFGKLRALVDGAAIVRRELAG